MKKISVLLLSGLLLVTSAPINSFAATDDSNKSTTTAEAVTVAEPYGGKTEPTDAALKNVILAMKEKIAVPEDYSEFNYYFYDSNSYSDAYWNLSWSNPNTGANIVVSCDLDYHIINFYKYDYKNRNSGIAKNSKSELQQTAESFINKIAPHTNGFLKFINSSYTSVYEGDYVYNYQRVKADVDFPDNTVSVSVNSITGEVTGASINWVYDVTFPSGKAKLTQDEATALIKDNMKMKLVYKSNYYNIYDKNGNLSNKAFLVYEPTQEYISIDATTGKVYTSRDEWVNTDKTEATAEDSSANKDATSSGSLTVEEIAKIEDLKNLISKEKAIKLVTGNSSLYRDDNLSKYSATLNQQSDFNGKTKYVWNVTLNDPREVTETDNYRGYAYATVDASTGKLLSYHASMKSNYNEKKQKWNSVTIKYDKEQSKAILEKFLKSQMKDRFSNSVIASQVEDYIAYYTKKEEAVYGGYSYQYNRTNEGIEYPDNNINGSVDGVTGKIYSFGSYWNENVTFEAATGVISADEAMKYYLGNKGYGLKYEVNQIKKYSDKNDTYSVEKEIRLVYRPDVNPIYISPFTGKQLNRNGEVYSETVPYAYKDIENSAANKNILLLADMNIGFAGENFLPNQNITLGEIKTLLTSIGYGYSTIEGDDAASITREELAQLFVNWLGLEKVSKLKIYSTGYLDASSISEKYAGAVALAKGLGIMKADSSNNFNPKNNVTRFEAVNYILNFIDAQQISSNY